MKHLKESSLIVALCFCWVLVHPIFFYQLDSRFYLYEESLSYFVGDVRRSFVFDQQKVSLRIGSTIFLNQLSHSLNTNKEEDIIVEDETIEEPKDQQSTIVNYIYDICERYESIDPEFVQAIVYYESNYIPNAVNYNGTCVGLMQLSTKWHTDRAKRLTGSTNLFDPYVNLVTGIDYLNDLIQKYGEDNLDLVLMIYNGSGNAAFTRHESGNITSYAKKVLQMRRELISGGT